MTEQAAGERWVGISQGTSAWAQAAGEILTEVAGHYLDVITYADLAEQVQARTGLRTRSPYRSWIGPVLARVVAQCRAAGLPPLTSLVSHRADGGTDLDEGTVAARLACYRRYAEDVPLEVIEQADHEARIKAFIAEKEAQERTRTRAPRAAAAPRQRKQRAPEEAPKICPTCFMQLPASGICDNCG
ncbi:MAG TPA: hypothetical protein VKY71_11370 [Actinotalea caeni]|uniref:hypothetical protein n=1 Tax=Actinotalea caeni TaxID=1348467 RepID=UPI002B4B2AB2|nr:hypothetical protein [Actinotalea caeni]HLV56161.1 hypothetical protein [Actinotalea caeni]